MKLPQLLLCALLASNLAAAQDKEPVNAGPYVPSPDSVVADMLKIADVGPKDFVIDLGSGNGKIVLTAAKVFGASGFGVEIQDKLVKESNEAAKREGVADRVKFVKQDLFKTDISRATVLTMYLLPNTVNMLKDKLLAELKPGTRVISHDYPLAGWIPEKYVQMDLEEKVSISGVTTTLIYLYLVPAKVAGSWSAKVPANVSKEPVRLRLQQQLTRVSGVAVVDGKELTLEEPKLHGTQISFRLPGRKTEFSGQVKGGTIEGLVEAGGVKSPWSASLGAK
jgi:SAM-dependent methyltransferase